MCGACSLASIKLRLLVAIATHSHARPRTVAALILTRVIVPSSQQSGHLGQSWDPGTLGI